MSRSMSVLGNEELEEDYFPRVWGVGRGVLGAGCGVLGVGCWVWGVGLRALVLRSEI